MLHYEEKPLVVIYDHHEALHPLFTSLKSRGITYDIVNTQNLDFAINDPGFSSRLIYHELSSPPYQSRQVTGIRASIEYLRHLESQNGTAGSSRIINGSRSTELLFTKSRQLGLFTSLGLAIPKTFFTSLANLPAVASTLHFPIYIKDNYNHHEGLFLRIENENELAERLIVDSQLVNREHLIIVQESIPLKGSAVIRVDVLNGTVIRATRITTASHPDYARPFETKSENHILSTTLQKSIEQIVHRGLLDAASIELGIDNRTNQYLFLGIHPFSVHTTNPADDQLLSDALATYIERRLLKIHEMELAL